MIAIKNFTPQINKINYSKQISNRNTENKTDVDLHKIPFYRTNVHFGKKTTNELFEEYNWYINHDKTPAIDAFLKIEDDKETMDGFLSTIFSTKDRSKQLIDSIVKQPRRSLEISNALKNKVGPNSKNAMTFFYDSPYRKAYEEYLDCRYNNAHTLSELLRIRPDWKGDVLMEKHRQLKHNDSLTIGCIPKEFPNNHIFQIADYLKEHMDYGLKTRKDVEPITIDNRTYEFKFFTEGRSDKNVFGVFTPEKKKYVLKMAPEKDKSLDKPFALGTLAKIDAYLTNNRSRNSAPLCYYNHDKNMSIYKYIEHQPAEGDTRDLGTISKKLPDFRALGLTYNDNVGYKNCFKLCEHSNSDIHNTEGFREGVVQEEWISVDNDHVTYANNFQPGITKYTAPLPNAMGMFF